MAIFEFSMQFTYTQDILLNKQRRAFQICLEINCSRGKGHYASDVLYCPIVVLQQGGDSSSNYMISFVNNLTGENVYVPFKRQ